MAEKLNMDTKIVRKASVYSKEGIDWSKFAIKFDIAKAFNEHSKEANINKIEKAVNAENFPAEFKSRIFSRDVLEKLDKKQVVHLMGLVSSMQVWQKQEARIKDTEVVHIDRTAVRLSKEDYVNAIKEIEGVYLNLPETNTELESGEIDADMELVNAFKFIGANVEKDADGQWQFTGENDNGFKYQDMDGNWKPFHLQKEEIESFCKGYLNVAKENRNNKITPKGLFKYYVNEIKESTRVFKRDKEVLEQAENEFSVDNLEWLSFGVVNNVVEDAKVSAYKSLIENGVSAIDLEKVAFADDIKSAKTNERCLERLQDDVNSIIDKLKNKESTIENNQIIEKYDDLINTLEEKQKRYKDTNLNTERIDKSIEDLEKTKKVLTVLSYAMQNAVNLISSKDVEGKLTPKQILAELAEHIAVNDNEIVFTEYDSLTHTEWDEILKTIDLSKGNSKSIDDIEDEDTIDKEDFPESKLDGNYLNIAMWANNFNLNGDNLLDVMFKDSLLERTRYFASNGGFIADSYEKFSKAYPDATYEEFVSYIMNEATEGNFLYDKDTLMAVEDVLTGKTSIDAIKINKDINAKTKEACFYLDYISEKIFSDEVDGPRFEFGSDEDRRALLSKYNSKYPVPDINTVDPQKVENAYNRWRPTILCNFDEKDFQDILEGCEADKSEQSDKLKNQYIKMMQDHQKNKENKNKTLSDEGKPVVTEEEREKDSQYTKAIYGDLYPVPTSDYQIKKSFMPYNTKEGKKFIEILLSKMAKMEVLVPKDVMGGYTSPDNKVKGDDENSNDNDGNENSDDGNDKDPITENNENSINKGVFAGLNNQQIKSKVAMYIANLSLQSVIRDLQKPGNSPSMKEIADDDLKPISDALKIMSIIDDNYPNDIPSSTGNITLPELLQRMFINRATGQEVDLTPLENYCSGKPEFANLPKGLANAFALFSPEVLLMTLGIASTSEKDIDNNTVYFNFGDLVEGEFFDALKNCQTQEEVLNVIRDNKKILNSIKGVAYAISRESREKLGLEDLEEMINNAEGKNIDDGSMEL